MKAQNGPGDDGHNVILKTATRVTATYSLWNSAIRWKRPWCWERLRVGGEGDDRGWHGWMASPTQWTWVWVNSGSWWWTGGLACCSPWGRKDSDTTEWLNWTDSPLYIKRKRYMSMFLVYHCTLDNITFFFFFKYWFFFNFILFLNFTILC